MELEQQLDHERRQALRLVYGIRASNTDKHLRSVGAAFDKLMSEGSKEEAKNLDTLAECLSPRRGEGYWVDGTIRRLSHQEVSTTTMESTTKVVYLGDRIPDVLARMKNLSAMFAKELCIQEYAKQKGGLVDLGLHVEHLLTEVSRERPIDEVAQGSLVDRTVYLYGEDWTVPSLDFLEKLARRLFKLPLE